MRKFSNDSLVSDFLSLAASEAYQQRETVLFADVSPAFSLQGPDSTNLQALIAFSLPVISQKADASGGTQDSLAEATAEFAPADPLYSSQWHLSNSGAGLLDINVETAWDDYTGAGIQVTVFDNGFDYLHADLAGNYLTAIDYDYTSGDFDAAPTLSSDNHGTSVIGIVGA